ncbi:hypothetical protein S245_017431, partial [Arachis hypogaea]
EKENIRRMFTLNEWTKNKLSNEAKGRQAIKIIIMPLFEIMSSTPLRSWALLFG